MFLQDVNLFLIAAVCGFIGGLVRVFFLEDRFTFGTWGHDEKGRYFKLGSFKYPLFGIISAIAAFAISQAFDDNEGLVALSLIAGFTAVFFFEKLEQNQVLKTNHDAVIDQLAKQNDDYEKAIKAGGNEADVA